MTFAEDDRTGAGARIRRCIVTGDVLPEARLLRFVAAPGGAILPDVQAKLPGRGIWLRAERGAVETAVKKRLFGKGAKAPVTADAGLAGKAESLLAERMLSLIGLARRSGQLILGFDTVERALKSDKPPAVIVEASDASEDGARKLQAAARSRGIAPFVIGLFSNAELSLAVGRGNVVHAALPPGHMAERLIFEAGRLEGFRPRKSWVWTGFTGGAAGSSWVAPLPPA
jgi:predicted RNA-binding protein YlxR (DUF448 family)/ribosomal protein L30E